MRSLTKHQAKGYSTLFTLILVLLISSCSKNNDDPVTPTPYVFKTYVHHEYVSFYSASGSKTVFELASTIDPNVSKLIDEIKYDITVFNVTYLTQFLGETIEASGLVCIPSTEGSEVPIISFQNGTNTSHAEAPTADPGNIFFKYLETSASMGYIMLLPDYIGFGASKQYIHPYVHKESTVSSIRDLIEATREMIDAELINTAWSKKVYLMGYSQGGWATLCTHKYFADNDELDIEIAASSCGAGPYELSIVQNFMFEGVTYPQPVYMAYTGVSYNSLGLISNPLTDYFNEPYATQLPTYFDGSLTNGEINLLLNDTVSVLVNPNFISGINTDPLYDDFRDAMANNSVVGWNTSQPIRLYHGTADTYVPPTTSENVYQQFVDAGAENMVNYYPLENMTHTTGAVPSIVNSLIWFNELESK